jgi:hypothetical protein
MVLCVPCWRRPQFQPSTASTVTPSTMKEMLATSVGAGRRSIFSLSSQIAASHSGGNDQRMVAAPKARGDRCRARSSPIRLYTAKLAADTSSHSGPVQEFEKCDPALNGAAASATPAKAITMPSQLDAPTSRRRNNAANIAAKTGSRPVTRAAVEGGRVAHAEKEAQTDDDRG